MKDLHKFFFCSLLCLSFSISSCKKQLMYPKTETPIKETVSTRQNKSIKDIIANIKVFNKNMSKIKGFLTGTIDYNSAILQFSATQKHPILIGFPQLDISGNIIGILEASIDTLGNIQKEFSQDDHNFRLAKSELEKFNIANHFMAFQNPNHHVKSTILNFAKSYKSKLKKQYANPTNQIKTDNLKSINSLSEPECDIIFDFSYNYYYYPMTCDDQDIYVSHNQFINWLLQEISYVQIPNSRASLQSDYIHLSGPSSVLFPYSGSSAMQLLLEETVRNYPYLNDCMSSVPSNIQITRLTGSCYYQNIPPPPDSTLNVTLYGIDSDDSGENYNLNPTVLPGSNAHICGYYDSILTGAAYSGTVTGLGVIACFYSNTGSTIVPAPMNICCFSIPSYGGMNQAAASTLFCLAYNEGIEELLVELKGLHSPVMAPAIVASLKTYIVVNLTGLKLGSSFSTGGCANSNPVTKAQFCL